MLTFEDFVERTQRARTVDELEACFQRAMIDEGYENNIFAAISRERLEKVSWQAFPSGYFETYVSEKWHRIDPIFAFALRAARPFRWKDAAPGLRLGRRQLEFLKDARRMGVRSGLIVPFDGPGGRREIVGFGERKSRRADPARLPVLQAFCTQTWCRHAELTGRYHADAGSEHDLSGRELEILRWIKHGKSNAETSEIIGVTVKTVEFHLGNILRKLGAGNRTAAVVIAIRNKLLEL
jgi:DNA-binding CsgD family transcriptional regulator